MNYKVKASRYFLYARKSSESEDRQMASIDSQIKELNKLAKDNELKIVKVFSESKSAKAPGREQFNEMINQVQQGKADGIICWKLNRLARNPIDGGKISWILQEGVVKHIQTFGKSYYPTDNVLLMAVELGMANQFIRDLSVDTKRGLRSKAERGWYPTFTTLGYMQAPYKHKGEKEIIEDPERFDLVKKMFDLMLRGSYNPVEILEIATNDWGLRNKKGKKIARSTIYRIFHDPFYYGEFEYPKGSGNWYKGRHKPMITKEEYIKINKLLGRELRTAPQTHTFAFTGMIKCGECGASITAENKIKRQKNGNVHYYTYYRCTKRIKPCSQKTIRLEELENQIENELKNIEIPKSFKDWMMQEIKKKNKDESSSRNQIIKNQEEKYNECVKKMDNLIDMRANDEIDKETFKRKTNELSEEKDKWKSSLNDSDLRVDDWLEQAEKLFSFAEIARVKFKHGDLKTKREILSCLGLNLSLKDQKLNIQRIKALDLLKEASAEVRRINKRLEPVKGSLNKRKLSILYAQSPTLLPGSDSNRRPIG